MSLGGGIADAFSNKSIAGIPAAAFLARIDAGTK
jgi:hypothetical protein